ncbi:MAG: phosphatase PAP2 family protein [Cyclobacteriaceae bacterium]
MLETILELDTELLLFFNGFHSSWMDPIMMLATKTLTWLPLYLALIYLIIKFKRWDTIYILLGVALTVTLADQITSSFMKPFFARLRPSQEESLIGVLHLVNNYKGGLYGFASSHAANTFGVATFIYLLFRARYPWITAIFLWASFVSYTRIYLGVHYPGDILVGAMVGILSGVTGFTFANFLLKEVQKRKATTH